MDIGIIQGHVFHGLCTDMAGQDIAQLDRELAFWDLDQRIAVLVVPHQVLKGDRPAWRRRQPFYGYRAGKELALGDDLVENVRCLITHVKAEAIKGGSDAEDQDGYFLEFPFMTTIPVIPHVLPTSWHSYH